MATLQSRYERRRQIKRPATGIHLVEMVVAVGLSGIFLLLLSSILSEALRLGTITQSELIAIRAVDLLAENAINTPYATLQANKALASQTDLVVVETDTADKATISTNPHRTRPVQLSLIDSMWGTFNPTTQGASLRPQWTKNNGNYFRGYATQEIEDSTGTFGQPSLKITNKVFFFDPSVQAGSPKIKKRVVYVFQNTGNDQGITR